MLNPSKNILETVPFELFDHAFSFLKLKELYPVSMVCKLFYKILIDRYKPLIKNYPLAMERFGPVKDETCINFYAFCHDSHQSLKTGEARVPKPLVIELNYNNTFFHANTNPIYLRTHTASGRIPEVITVGKKGSEDPTIYRWNYLTGQQIDKSFKVPVQIDDYSLLGFSNHHIACPYIRLFSKLLFGNGELGKGRFTSSSITAVLVDTKQILLGLENGNIVSQKDTKEKLKRYVKWPKDIQPEPITTLYKTHNLFFVGTTQGTIQVYSKKKIIWTFKVASEPRFIKKYKDFVFISQDKTVVCWHLTYKTQVAIFQHEENVTGLTLMDDLLVTTASDGCLRFWNFEDLHDLRHEDLFELSQESGDSEEDRNSMDLNKLGARQIEPRMTPNKLFKFTVNREVVLGFDTMASQLSDVMIRGNHLLFIKDRNLMVYNLFKINHTTDYNSWLNPLSYLKDFNSRFFK